jgi:DNA topoisomerase IA
MNTLPGAGKLAQHGLGNRNILISNGKTRGLSVNKPLVVVESPTKVRTIKKYLGKDYNVAATVGHIKDLPGKEMGIDVENGFKPKYSYIPGKQKVIKSLKQAAGDANDIFLAPDPDREGEAIAWHTAEVLKKKANMRPSRPAAYSIDWSDTRCRRCCGAR